MGTRGRTRRLPKEFIGLWMLAVLAHWAVTYGLLAYHLARYALEQVLGLA